jgi:SOS-response transcriptional repressor LexA
VYLARDTISRTVWLVAKTPGDIFKELREARDWSFRDAAKAAGVAHGTIQRAENGELTSDNVTAHVVKGLARAYGVSEQTIHDIFSGQYGDIDGLKDLRHYLRRFEVHPDWVAVPVYGSASAGDAAAEPSMTEFSYVPREVFKRHGSDPRRVRAYRVNGSCMISAEAKRMDKNYVEGDTIVVDPEKIPEPGDVVVAWWADEQVMILKRYEIEREGIVLYPAAPGRSMVVLPHEDRAAVLGPVIWRGG